MSMRLLPAFILAAGAAAAAAAPGPRASIELLPQAQVATEAVLLGHVAHLRSTDLALMRKLVNLPIGRAPRAGEPAVVGREALAQWIRREAGVPDGELEWLGVEATRVLRVARQLRGEEIAAAATQALRDWLAAQGLHADVQPRQLPRDIDAPAGELRLQARPLALAQPRSRMLVWVDVFSDERFVRTVPVALDLGGGLAPLHGPAAPAAAGAPLQPGLAVPAAGNVPPLVARGEWATLRSAAGVVTLESRVEVLQDGRSGQRVRVRQPGATGVVFARVVGPAQLELAP